MINFDNLRRDKECGSAVNLLDVMPLMRDRDCKDPRDKVYAALGMAMDVYGDQIVPDYTKRYVDIYIDVARSCISGPRPRLAFLSHVIRPSSCMTSKEKLDFEVPSWVPDSTIRSGPNSLRVLVPGQSVGAYNACAATPGNYRMNDCRLEVSGSVLDRITDLSSVCQTFNTTE
jgi:hypothetical protein